MTTSFSYCATAIYCQEYESKKQVIKKKVTSMLEWIPLKLFSQDGEIFKLLQDERSEFDWK